MPQVQLSKGKKKKKNGEQNLTQSCVSQKGILGSHNWESCKLASIIRGSSVSYSSSLFVGFIHRPPLTYGAETTLAPLVDTSPQNSDPRGDLGEGDDWLMRVTCPSWTNHDGQDKELWMLWTHWRPPGAGAGGQLQPLTSGRVVI